MKVLASSFCGVRSAALTVVLLVGAFILLPSYNWRLLPSGRSRLDMPSFTPSALENGLSLPAKAPSLAPVFSKRENALPSNVIPSDISEATPKSLGGHQLPSNDNNLEEPTTTKDKQTPHNGAGLLPPSRTPSLSHPGGQSELVQYDEASAKAETLTALEDSVISVSDSSPRKDRDDEGSSRALGQNEVAHSTGAEHVVTYEDQLQNNRSVAASSQKRPIHKYEDLSSLQRLELSLWQARAAMRKIVLAQTNPSTAASIDRSLPKGEPSGDVYRNAAVFRQSYREMEKRLKVYAYPEGEEPLVHNGPCKEIYAVEGRFIQELQGDNRFITYDPDAAHVFFLPFSVSMMVTYLYTANSRDMSPLLRFVKDYVDVVSHKYPYWKRSDGADHFMLSCHDWGPHVSRADANLVSKTIRVLCNANVSEGYIPNKDVSLPEIHLVGGEIPAELGGLPASQRTLLAFFAGGDHGPVRPALFQSWEGKDADVLVYHQVPSEGKSYHEHMKSSKYCLCPGGYEVNSPRIVESIYNECVPVVIADNFVLPFSDVLDWKKFSLFIAEKDIPNLKSILQAIEMETYISMQDRVKQVKRHFLINQPPERYDVFHMILHSVWLRRLNIKILQ